MAVENDERIAKIYQRLFPQDQVIVGDAHEYLRAHYEEFDFVWSSPPCQTHSKMNKATRHKLDRYIDLTLYEEILYLTHKFAGGWLVENVVPYYKPLVEPSIRIGRHLFWSNFKIENVVDIKRPEGFINGTNLKAKAALMEWLGIYYPENIYYGTNHCPAQILRNCVHPEIGRQIFESYLQNK